LNTEAADNKDKKDSDPAVTFYGVINDPLKRAGAV